MAGQYGVLVGGTRLGRRVGWWGWVVGWRGDLLQGGVGRGLGGGCGGHGARGRGRGSHTMGPVA